MNHLYRSVLGGLVAALAISAAIQAQEIHVFDRTVQLHGFASQGFVKTDQNNWLTMNTSKMGSGQFTEFGANASTQVTDKFRIGAQIYDRELGQLGRWHPQLDWAYADFKFKPWLGVRGGKVKTVLGLYNDTQDLDFLHTFALMPQGVYPTDMRDATLAHIGGDVYGTLAPIKRLGKFSYTGYVGDQVQSIYGGYPYLLTIHGIYIDHTGGLTYGGDLRWQTPVKGLLGGASYEGNRVRNTGQLNPSVALGGPDILVPYWEQSRSQFTEQAYGEYTRGNLRVDAEYRRFWRDFTIFDGQFLALIGTNAWYPSAAYRVNKWFEFGGYYSHMVESWIITVPGVVEASCGCDPSRHIYDTAVTARFDVNTHWYAKAEGHFMNGNAAGSNPQYPEGFYPQVNANGLEPNTTGLVLKSGFNF